MPCCVPFVDEGTLECWTGAPLERVDGTFVTSAHEDVLDGPPEQAVEHIEEPILLFMMVYLVAIYRFCETILTSVSDCVPES